MHDRMTALGFRNRFVRGKTQTLMTELVPPAGVRWRAIVSVNNVTRRATARSIIARMIVRPEKSEKRIVQSCFLQTEKDRIGAIQCSETALRKAAIGFAVWFRTGRQSEGELRPPAFFENAQNVSGVAQIKSWQRFDERQDAVNLRFFGGDRRVVDQLQRRAIR